MSNFKIILISIFAICIVVGIAVFATYRANGGQQAANLIVWGTISPDAFDSAYKASSVFANKQINVTYVKKDSSTFDANFVDALASGTGPDVVILRDDYIYKNSNKLYPIPFSSYPERTFKDQFIQNAEIFLTPTSVVALPLFVDPMVMYWNRDIFTNNLISQPPKYWDELYSLSNTITKKDSSANILQSTVAFGEWANISHAKEILSLLMLQAGTPIVVHNSVGAYNSVIADQFDLPVAPGESALNFYTGFSNPTGVAYSWNRSLPSSLNFFLSGNLALYFGYASEIYSIQQKNPNLNFDVAPVPQVRDSKNKISYGHMYATAIVKQSKSLLASYSLVTSLTESASQKALSASSNLPPIRRDLLSVKPNDAYQSVFYSSALISRSWFDPDSTATSNIFRDMIESITSGQAKVSGALGDAEQSINALFK